MERASSAQRAFVLAPLANVQFIFTRIFTLTLNLELIASADDVLQCDSQSERQQKHPKLLMAMHIKSEFEKTCQKFAGGKAPNHLSLKQIAQEIEDWFVGLFPPHHFS